MWVGSSFFLRPLCVSWKWPHVSGATGPFRTRGWPELVASGGSVAWVCWMVWHLCGAGGGSGSGARASPMGPLMDSTWVFAVREDTSVEITISQA